ncbi:MAG: hypothetical protein IJB75_07770 [Oscillospiraceae bacterium]|nr:hypothetical protein [Oscillospiraceae bacterium]
MAVQQRTTAYRVNGSAAYAPAYTGGVIRAPHRQEEQHSVPKRAPRRQTIARPQVAVREAGHVAPFAIVGFLAVGVFAVLLLLSTLQLHVASDNVVALRNQLSTLRTEQAALSARYEQEFDLQHLQAAVEGTMIRPTPDQITYINMSRPDSVVLFNDVATSGAAGAAKGAGNIFSSMVEYFR